MESVSDFDRLVCETLDHGPHREEEEEEEEAAAPPAAEVKVAAKPAKLEAKPAKPAKLEAKPGKGEAKPAKGEAKLEAKPAAEKPAKGEAKEAGKPAPGGTSLAALLGRIAVYLFCSYTVLRAVPLNLLLFGAMALFVWAT